MQHSKTFPQNEISVCHFVCNFHCSCFPAPVCICVCMYIYIYACMCVCAWPLQNPRKIQNGPSPKQISGAISNVFSCFLFLMFSYGKFEQKYPRKKDPIQAYVGLCRALLVGIYGYIRHSKNVKNNYWLRGFLKFPVLFLCTGVYICICIQAWPLKNPLQNLQQTSPK